jgi:polyphosphate:AMP phosphotransferase
MFEKIALNQKISDAEYENVLPTLQRELGALQREAHQLKIPLMLVFEGWHATGVSNVINELILGLDPRGVTYHTIGLPTVEERQKPFLWRFWIRTPIKGAIAIFDHSWYSRSIIDRKRGGSNPHEGHVRDITNFEQQLADGGMLILKFFFYVSKKTLKKRLEQRRSAVFDTEFFSDESGEIPIKFNQYLDTMESTIEKTDVEGAPWTIIEAEDKKFAVVKTLVTIIKALGHVCSLQADRGAPAGATGPANSAGISSPVGLDLDTSVLANVNLTKSLSPSEYRENLEKYKEKTLDLQYALYTKKIPLIIVFEGWDAAGKGGNIKRLTQHLNPRGYSVKSIAAPNDFEKAHHYLWRFIRDLPEPGHIMIFDRSWYGRVLVERVEGYCTEVEWRRAYHEINEMEQMLVDYGAILVKFWLQIDKDEQIKRFTERQTVSYKKYKITEDDWRNREKWDLYQRAVDEMLKRTSTTFAPWTIVEANNKYYSRIKTLKTIIDVTDAGV